MANVLINGVGAVEIPPPKKEVTMSTPTWGYGANGASQIFELKDGESLPAGWFDHPDKATSVPEPEKAKRVKKSKEENEGEPVADGDSNGN